MPIYRLIAGIILIFFFFGPASPVSAGPLRVGLVQFPVRSGVSESEFIAKVEKYVVEARAAGNSLIVLPELLVLDQLHYGELASEKRQIDRLATDFFPRYLAFAQRLAQREHISLLAGSAPRKVGTAIRNTAIYVEPTGKTILQDKLFLTPEEKNWGWEGGTELRVWQTPYGPWTILICYDVQFAEISALLGPVNPTLILVPSMTGEKGLHRVRFAAQARAVEHHAYVALSGTVSAIGPQDREYVGQNVVVPPQDEGFPKLVAEGPFNIPAITSAALDFSLLENSRLKAGIYSSRDYGKETRKGLRFRVVLEEAK
jgi:predicted amidohydrolase